jgi:hypothetical protein
MEDTYREIMALAERYARTEVTEYERKVYLREGRRTLIVWDPQEGTVEVRKPRTKAEAKRLSEALEILGIERRATPHEVEAGGEVVDAVYLWQRTPRSAYGSPSLTAISDVETFSMLTQASLSTAAAKRAHQAALDAYWEVPNA